ncbi:MAG TPA: MerR family transcriptional regulator, partial [Fusibacter sp.]|nr:MerR family transcriptional regulator [Fusibacter sp.]
MEYTVNKLAEISGVTTRTLRYYDEIGLLKPARISSSGYRIYGRLEVNLLQQILFYRELEVSLDEIKAIMTSETFDARKALTEHHEKLLEKRERLERLIANVEKTILESEGRLMMSDREKFEGLKKNMLNENEAKYGAEIREKYGEETVAKSNAKFANLSKADFERSNQLAEEIIESLLKGMDSGDASGEDAQDAAKKHKEWLMFYWP